jgi:hypothetical protein
VQSWVGHRPCTPCRAQPTVLAVPPLPPAFPTARAKARPYHWRRLAETIRIHSWKRGAAHRQRPALPSPGSAPATLGTSATQKRLAKIERHTAPNPSAHRPTSRAIPTDSPGTALAERAAANPPRARRGRKIMPNPAPGAPPRTNPPPQRAQRRAAVVSSGRRRGDHPQRQRRRCRHTARRRGFPRARKRGRHPFRPDDGGGYPGAGRAANGRARPTRPHPGNRPGADAFFFPPPSGRRRNRHGPHHCPRGGRRRDAAAGTGRPFPPGAHPSELGGTPPGQDAPSQTRRPWQWLRARPPAQFPLRPPPPPPRAFAGFSGTPGGKRAAEPTPDTPSQAPGETPPLPKKGKQRRPLPNSPPRLKKKSPPPSPPPTNTPAGALARRNRRLGPPGNT